MPHKTLATSLVLLGIAVLVSGCGKSIRDWMQSFSDADPSVIVLYENSTLSKEERWLGVRGMSNVNTIGGFVVRSDAEGKDMYLRTNNKTIPERTYYVFVSPSRHQHTWNIETDEPNYIYHWYDGELNILKQTDGIYRDENNRLMPPGWQPPPPEPKPWHDVFNLLNYIGGITLIVAIGLAIMVRTRIRSWWRQRMSVKAQTPPS